MEFVSLSGEAPVFVGRAEELAALDAAFDRVQQGQPSAVLIGGEAGVGKSRLLSKFAARARAVGVTRVLYGYCLELSADGLPFAPFTGVLTSPPNSSFRPRPLASMYRTSRPSSMPPAVPRQQPSPTGSASPTTAPERLAPRSPRGCHPLGSPDRGARRGSQPLTRPRPLRT
jgi:AAA ATPase domain